MYDLLDIIHTKISSIDYLVQRWMDDHQLIKSSIINEIQSIKLNINNYHKKYVICKNWADSGTCMYGDHCWYLHNKNNNNSNNNNSNNNNSNNNNSNDNNDINNNNNETLDDVTSSFSDSTSISSSEEFSSENSFFRVKRRRRRNRKKKKPKWKKVKEKNNLKIETDLIQTKKYFNNNTKNNSSNNNITKANNNNNNINTENMIGNIINDKNEPLIETIFCHDFWREKILYLNNKYKNNIREINYYKAFYEYFVIFKRHGVTSKDDIINDILSTKAITDWMRKKNIEPFYWFLFYMDMYIKDVNLQLFNNFYETKFIKIYNKLSEFYEHLLAINESVNNEF